MDILLTTMVGLEETVLKEAKQRFGLEGEKLRNGRVVVKGDLEDVARLNYSGRTFERVMIVLDVIDGIETLEDVYGAVKGQDFSEYFGPEETFACRSDRMGEHSFTSLDIERTAGQAVVDYFLEETGKRIRANLTEPDVIVRADLDGGRPLHIHRHNGLRRAAQEGLPRLRSSSRTERCSRVCHAPRIGLE